MLERYNKDEFHLKHGKIVSGVMGYFAKKFDAKNVEFWEVVGMLHDLDFELYPEQHCIKQQEMMRELDIDEKIIHATASHGYYISALNPLSSHEQYANNERTYPNNGYQKR